MSFESSPDFFKIRNYYIKNRVIEINYLILKKVIEEDYQIPKKYFSNKISN